MEFIFLFDVFGIQYISQHPTHIDQSILSKEVLHCLVQVVKQVKWLDTGNVNLLIWQYHLRL